MKMLAPCVLIIALAGCSKAPDSSVGEPDVVGNTSAAVAFNYSYSLALPSPRIGDLQEDHARACEQLGPARCRITGLGYTVGERGDVNANLAIEIAAPIARGFGRDAVKRAEAMGARLTGADIRGTDVAADSEATTLQRTQLDADRAKMTRELARTDMSSRERTELLRQRAALDEPVHAVEADTLAQRDRLAMTPMTFFYRTGRGTALVDRVRDAGDTAVGSVRLTATDLLWVLAALGPPLVVLALLYLLWRRWGRRWWRTLVERADRG